MNYSDALSGSLGSLIGLIAGFILALIISRQLRNWLDALKSVDAITTLRKRNSDLNRELVASEKTVKKLTEQNNLLRQELAELKETLHHREGVINALLKKVDQRDLQIKKFTEELERVHAYQEAFETKLFDFLTVHAGVDPDEIKWRIGLEKKKKP